MECAATDNVEVAKVAVPLLSGPVPKVVAPSLKVTVPVGVPEPGADAVTVAVKVTDCPNTDGFCELMTAVVLPPWFTVCVSVDDVLPAKFVSPP